jgi:hypothetical protein
MQCGDFGPSHLDGETAARFSSGFRLAFDLRIECRPRRFLIYRFALRFKNREARAPRPHANKSFLFAGQGDLTKGFEFFDLNGRLMADVEA